MIKYAFSEIVRRIVQFIFVNELFDLPILSFFKNLFFKLCFKVGKKPVINPGVRLLRSHKSTSGKICIGDNVILGRNAIIDYTGNVKIGNNVWISENVLLFSHDHDTRSRDVVKNNIIIEDDVWIGAGSIILPNVRKIGKGSVIGAGSVVTSEVKRNTLVCGNPAVIKKEFK